MKTQVNEAYLLKTQSKRGIPKQAIKMAALSMIAGAVFTATAEQVTHQVNGDTEVWRIDGPRVDYPSMSYLQILFRPGDRVVVDAGGCVQTGGGGATWRRYVDPSGPASETYYHGLVYIPGVTSNLVRISGIHGKLFTIPAIYQPSYLWLGYEDNNYLDNGYWGRDDGEGNQCQGLPNAWVKIGIVHYNAPSPGSSSFNCGPNLFTYAVYSLNGVSGSGVRCVQFTTERSNAGPRFVWYGEGSWGAYRYRHLGIASQIPGGIRGYASDFTGNGESGGSTFPGNIVVDFVGGAWPAPAQIRLTGAWAELWMLVRETPYLPLPPVNNCGAFMVPYSVSATSGSASTGVRCLTQFNWEFVDNVWFGRGNWGGGGYAHLGLFEYVSDYVDVLGPDGYFPFLGTASDLCGPAFGQICGSTRTRGIEFVRPNSYDFQYLLVGGAWHEYWSPLHVATPPGTGK